MKIKYAFIAIISFLLIISVSQIISIPPYSGQIFNIYKSGYFDELDREFEIIKDSFINIKTMGKTEYGWIFLNEINKKHNIDIKIYDRNGYEITAPGEKSEKTDREISKILNSQNPEIQNEVNLGEYKYIMPIYSEKKCKFCHGNVKHNKIIGALKFRRKYDAHVYYSAERIIIFLIISILLTAALFFLIKWDPEKNIKEMFDNL